MKGVCAFHRERINLFLCECICVTLVNEFGRGEFDVFDEIGKCYRRVKMSDDVDVIFNPIDSVHMAFLFLEDPGDVAEKFVAMIRCHSPLTMFRTKNNLIQDLGECTHAFY